MLDMVLRKKNTLPCLATLIFLCYSGSCFSQKEANVWLFDNNLGIDFNDNRFLGFNTTINMDQVGATASICDPQTGKLKFFTNSRTIWNSSFSIMENGTGLMGGIHTQQATLIVPVPDSGSKYYVFTTKSIEDPYPGGEAGLYYSIVDMERNNGLGAVLQTGKNTMLLQAASEKLIAVPHANGREYWLITHEGNSDRFVVFLISSSGIEVGTAFPFGIPYGYYESKGWLQASPNGKLLACAVSSDQFERNPLELYDFDPLLGVISNRRVLGDYPGLTGVSFSPDNSKLYFTYVDQLNEAKGSLCQMDLTAGDVEAVKQSLVSLYAVHDAFSDFANNTQYDTIRDGVLQLAPDGRLYLKFIVPYSTRENGIRVVRNKIYYIDKPNLPGFASEPMGRDINFLFSSPNGWSFPNFMPHYFNNLEPIDNTGEESCGNKNILVYPNPTQGIITVELGNQCAMPVTLEIFSTTGQRLSHQTLLEPTRTIDLAPLASAMYVLVFHFSEHKVVKKIMVR